MRWPGFRKVRRQVCKRIDRRIGELGLSDTASYRDYLEQRPDEWRVLDPLCRITISRFYRDKAVFRFLEQDVLPALARTTGERGEHELRCWSIGCASGEEPYTLALLWDAVILPAFPKTRLSITATDADPAMIERAEAGCYGTGSLKELPREWMDAGFEKPGNRYCVRENVREIVGFAVQDVRDTLPGGSFHLILCRNLVFTYFDEELQRQVLASIRERLLPGGALVVGIHESLPQGAAGFTPWSQKLGVYSLSEKQQTAGGDGEDGHDRADPLEPQVE
jgi:chemotaxis protein methyltransferase CheR